MFSAQADGSLVVDDQGQVRGSHLLAQPFSDPKYFQPRPSSVGYNAAASGGSNLAATTRSCCGRVAQQLGLIARYKADGPRKGAAVGPDVEKWFITQVKEKNPQSDRRMGKGQPIAGGRLGRVLGSCQEYVLSWSKKHPEILDSWKKANPDKSEPQPSDVGDLAGDFFASYTKVNPGTFPGVKEEGDKGNTKKVISPVTEGDEIRSIFFDTWLTENPEKIDPLVDLEQVRPIW